jgi:hypothetical protein
MFVPNTPNIKNNYSHAIKTALAAFTADADLAYYVVTPEDFKRPDGSNYAVASAAAGLNKLLTAMRLPHEAVVGKDDGESCVAIVNPQA